MDAHPPARELQIPQEARVLYSDDLWNNAKPDRNVPSPIPELILHRCFGRWTLCERSGSDESLISRRPWPIAARGTAVPGRMSQASLRTCVLGPRSSKCYGHRRHRRSPGTFRAYRVVICPEAMRIAEISAASQTACMVRSPLSERRLHRTRPTSWLACRSHRGCLSRLPYAGMLHKCGRGRRWRRFRSGEAWLLPSPSGRTGRPGLADSQGFAPSARRGRPCGGRS